MSAETVFPATMVANCPSGPVSVCDDHAEKLAIIMGMMGCRIAFTEAPDGAMCSNCINELSVQKGKS